MDIDGIAKSAAVFRKFMGDGDGWAAVYRDYRLSGVFIGGRRILEEDWREVGGIKVYFFYSISVCEECVGGDEYVEAAFPEVEKGDLCVIGGREYRVAEAAYYRDAGELSHVRLVLK